MSRIVGRNYVANRALEIALVGLFPIHFVGPDDSLRGYYVSLTRNLAATLVRDYDQPEYDDWFYRKHATDSQSCPCGNSTSAERFCPCSEENVMLYRTNNYPLKAIFVEIRPSPWDELLSSSEDTLNNVYTKEGLLNKVLDVINDSTHYKSPLHDQTTKNLAKHAIIQHHLGDVTWSFIKEVASIIACMAGEETVQAHHLAEAIQYRRPSLLKGGE